MLLTLGCSPHCYDFLSRLKEVISAMVVHGSSYMALTFDLNPITVVKYDFRGVTHECQPKCLRLL